MVTQGAGVDEELSNRFKPFRFPDTAFRQFEVLAENPLLSGPFCSQLLISLVRLFRGHFLVKQAAAR